MFPYQFEFIKCCEFFSLNTIVGKRESLYILAALFSSLHGVFRKGKSVITQCEAADPHRVRLTYDTAQTMVCIILDMYRKLLEVCNCNT